MKEAIIYQANYPKVGEVFVARREAKIKISPSLLANFLIYLGVLTALLFISPFLMMEMRYRFGSIFASQPKENSTFKKSELAEVIYLSNLKMLKPVDPEFSLIIPKIGLNSAIIANVPAGDENQYKKDLKQGVAHAAGSFFPGQNGSIYLFGHSTDYIWNISQFNAVFYLLKELEPNDQINIFYQNNRYIYKAVDKKVTSAKDIKFLKPQNNQEIVILQTCWPPGTLWKRLVVTAQRV